MRTNINAGGKYFFDKTFIVDDEKNLSDEHLSKIKSLSNKYIDDYFSRKEIKNLLDEIYRYFRLKKIEFIALDTNILKTTNNKIQLSIIIKKTKSNYVNIIDIGGNTITEEKVIRRNLVFAEGDCLNHKLSKSMDNLKSTGIFKDVKMKINKKNDDLVDVNIEVEEQPTGSIQLELVLALPAVQLVEACKKEIYLGREFSIF